MDSKILEIPFGAKDSELKGFEYRIPKGMEAEIKDGKVIIKSKESEDERIRKELLEYAKLHLADFEAHKDSKSKTDQDNLLWWRKVVAYLEKQKDEAQRQFNLGIQAGREEVMYEMEKEQNPAESISQLSVKGKGVYKICPHCKERMIRDDSKVYTSIPPQYGYNCPKCGAIEFDTVVYDNPEIEEQKPMYNLEIPAGDVAPAEEDSPFDEDEFLEYELSAFLQNYDKEYDDDAAVSDVARHFYEIGKKAKQKPVDIKIYNPNVQKFDPDVKVTTSDSSASGKELLYVSNKSYDIGFRDGVASVKPAEWSEEDERILKGIIGKIDHDQTYGVSKVDMLSFLKSIRPQPRPSKTTLAYEDYSRYSSPYNCNNNFNYSDTIMKKKPFNIEESKSGARVITRDGRKVRVVCYDAGGKKPILAYYEDRYGKHAEFYTEDGLVGEGCQSYHDLFLDDEPIKKDEADSVEKDRNELQKYFKSINEAFEDGRKFERGFTQNPSLSDKELICLKRTLDFLRKEHNRYGGEDFTNEIVVLEWMITHPTMIFINVPKRPHWKPSEEQLKTLSKVLDDTRHNGDWRYAWPILESLYNGLKKLI